jgi:uncharacterized protein
VKKLTWKAKIAGATGIVLAAFLALNGLAYNHAYAMMHFAGGGKRTPKPERLSFGPKLRVLLTGIHLPRPVAARAPSDVGMPFEDRVIRCTNGIRLSAWYIPSSRSATLVILFHGYGAEKSSLLTEARLIHDLGCAVLLVDFRGSGGSSEAVTTVGILEAEDVAAITAYAKANIPHRRLILFGQSMGAAAVLRGMAREGVKPDGIIMEAVFDTMLHTVQNRFKAMGVPSFPSAQLLVFWGGAQIGANAFANRPVEYARTVACPALFMQGTNDPRATRTEARRVFDAVQGTKTWKEFGGAGHESYAVFQPKEWVAAVAQFIRECEAGN